MKITFNHIHILCKDLSSIINFFVDTFGAKLVEMRQFGGADGASLELDGLIINLRVAQESEKVVENIDCQSYGYHHIGLEVEDMETIYKDITSKGYSFSVPPKDLSGMKIAFFEGPEKLTFELMQKTS